MASRETRIGLAGFEDGRACASAACSSAGGAPAPGAASPVEPARFGAVAMLSPDDERCAAALLSCDDTRPAPPLSCDAVLGSRETPMPSRPKRLLAGLAEPLGLLGCCGTAPRRAKCCRGRGGLSRPPLGGCALCSTLGRLAAAAPPCHILAPLTACRTGADGIDTARIMLCASAPFCGRPRRNPIPCGGPGVSVLFETANESTWPPGCSTPARLSAGACCGVSTRSSSSVSGDITRSGDLSPDGSVSGVSSTSGTLGCSKPCGPLSMAKNMDIVPERHSRRRCQVASSSPEERSHRPRAARSVRGDALARCQERPARPSATSRPEGKI